MTPAEHILDHVRSQARHARRPGSDGWRHHNVADLLLAEGRLFEPAPLPGDVYPALPGPPSRAAMILADQFAWTYVEGVALLPDLRTVIEHAWCATFTGQVVDPNLAGESAAAYLGVAFTMKYRREAAARAGGYRPILITDRHGGSPTTLDPLLRDGLPADALVAVGGPLIAVGTVADRAAVRLGTAA